MHPNCSPVPFTVIVWTIETFCTPLGLLEETPPLDFRSLLSAFILTATELLKVPLWKSWFSIGWQQTGQDRECAGPSTCALEGAREGNIVWGRGAEEDSKDHQCTNMPLLPPHTLFPSHARQGAFCSMLAFALPEYVAVLFMEDSILPSFV